VPLELIRAQIQSPSARLNSRAPDAANEKFALLFQGPADAPLESGIHTFEQAKLGRFSMFISPVTAGDTDYRYYEAVFNRAVGTQEVGRHRDANALNSPPTARPGRATALDPHPPN